MRASDIVPFEINDRAGPGIPSPSGRRPIFLVGTARNDL
jgi:hypothetical protein